MPAPTSRATTMTRPASSTSSRAWRRLGCHPERCCDQRQKTLTARPFDFRHAEGERVVPRGRCRAQGAEDADPPREHDAEIAVALVHLGRVVHAMQSAGDEDEVKRALQGRRQGHVAMLERSQYGGAEA